MAWVLGLCVFVCACVDAYAILEFEQGRRGATLLDQGGTAVGHALGAADGDGAGGGAKDGEDGGGLHFDVGNEVLVWFDETG